MATKKQKAPKVTLTTMYFSVRGVPYEIRAEMRGKTPMLAAGCQNYPMSEWVNEPEKTVRKSLSLETAEWGPFTADAAREVLYQWYGESDEEYSARCAAVATKNTARKKAAERSVPKYAAAIPVVLPIIAKKFGVTIPKVKKTSKKKAA